jgi:putative ABC transport system permease protein
MIYLKLGWRDIRQRPGRAVLTLLSIVIGVGAMVAVTLTTHTTRRAFDAIYQTIAGRAGLEVAGPVGTSFDESLLAKVSDVPGVAAAAPLIQRRSVLYVGDRRVQLVALGIDPKLDHAVHDYEITAGHSLEEANGILLNDGFASNVGAKVDDQVEMLTRYGLMKTRVVGLYTSHNTAVTGQGAVLLMQLRAAQYLFKAPKKLDAIQIVLVPDANEAAVEGQIAARLPDNVTVERPAARSPMAEQTSLSTEEGLKMARAFSLLVALFIITNTFLINVTQRRRPLGIMRAIGATRRQVAGLVVSEALLLGVIGTILGCGVGYVVAQYLAQAMGTLYQTTLPPIELHAGPFLLAAALGVGISLLGAAMPARKASHLSPLEAMRDVLPEEIEGASRWFVMVGIGLIVVSLALMLVSIVGWIPMFNAVWCSVLLLVGLVLVLPVALGPLSSLVAALLRPWLGVEGRLARRQLLRQRARTTLTTGVVFIAISTGIGLATAVIDNVQDVKNWYHKAIVADFFVRAMAPEMATGLAADLPDELDPQIRQVPGIKSIEAVRFVSAKAAGQTVVLFVRDFSNKHELEFDIENDDLDAIRERLHQGEVVIGSVLAQQANLKAGDDISLDMGGESQQQFRVAAVANDYQAGGLTIYIERDVAKKLLGIQGIDAYIIKADHARLNEVRRALQKLCNQYGLLLQSFSDIQHKIDMMMAGVVAGLWGMVVLGLVVAAFGVANTLTMTVLEQTRELGLLRILAMTRWQVRKSILAQALMMGVLALVPGIAAGVGVAYLISWATLPVIGHSVPFTIHAWLLIGSFVVGLVIVAAAAWLPAERAARLELPVALRYT